MIDVLGTTAQIGDKVAIADRRSNSAYLRIGNIIELDEDKGKFKVQWSKDKFSYWMSWNPYGSLDRVVILK